jgi:hypothetical protein
MCRIRRIQKVRIPRMPRRREDHGRGTDTVEPTSGIGAAKSALRADSGWCRVPDWSGRYGLAARHRRIGHPRSDRRESGHKHNRLNLRRQVTSREYASRSATMLRARNVCPLPRMATGSRTATMSDSTWPLEVTASPPPRAFLFSLPNLRPQQQMTATRVLPSIVSRVSPTVVISILLYPNTSF